MFYRSYLTDEGRLEYYLGKYYVGMKNRYPWTAALHVDLNQQCQDGRKEKAVRDVMFMVRTTMLCSRFPKRAWERMFKFVWVDNTATLAVVNGNDFTHETVQHVTVKVRFLQECVQRKILLLAPIRTHQNIADILTKQSAGPQFRMHRNYILGMTDAIDIQVGAMAARVTVSTTRRHQLKRKRILARQECDDSVKF